MERIIAGTAAPLRVKDAPENPLTLFEEWFKAARETDERNARVVVLATASGKTPAARMVLLKEFDEHGFIFYTNYESRKGRELSVNPCAALLFWWPLLERQVRLEGAVRKVSKAAADEYFSKRPRDSQLAAWASPQSETLPSRAALEASVEKARQRFGKGHIPRPKNWGGLCFMPIRFEFWQGRANRLHDRILYRRAGSRWIRERLAP
jgi:pyridoxamine 5'-phosphate oxidase